MSGMDKVVNVMRPPTTQDETGGTVGQPVCVRRDVPCEIEELTATETRQVHSVFPEATQIVRYYADPLRPVTAADYFTGGFLKERQLHVIGTVDRKGLGMLVESHCEEAR